MRIFFTFFHFIKYKYKLYEVFVFISSYFRHIIIINKHYCTTLVAESSFKIILINNLDCITNIIRYI